MAAVAALEEEVRTTSRMGEMSGPVTDSMATLTDRVKQLTSHCNVILINDSLREWSSALADRKTATPDTNAVSWKNLS